MAGTKRERQLARERYLRQQARRAQKDARRRRRYQVIAAVLTVLAVVGGSVWFANYWSNRPEPVATADPGDDTEPDNSVACTYTASGDAAKDVGVPPDSAPPADPFTATLKTNRGTVTFTSAAEAPCTSRSFAYLAGKKYFDGTSCHRLTTDGLFVLQCGDPTGKGTGGPGYGFGLENAPPDGKFPAGTVAMARSSEPDSNGSQFFLVYKDTTLPTDGGGYSIFGKITKGLDVVQAIAKDGVKGSATDGAPAQAVRLESVTTGGS